MNDIQSLSHSKWRCQYHVVFAPKYRRKVIYGKLKKDIGEILRKLCEQKKVETVEASLCRDHVHMLRKRQAKPKCVAVYGFSKREE